jgi:adenine phosphoribosyltransferase
VIDDLPSRLRANLRAIPDYPKPGILFQDITPFLGDARLLPAIVAALAAPYHGNGVTHVLGIEARGFILGGAVAVQLGAGFVPARKPGKLPWKALRETYALEYGTDALDMHEDALPEGARALIIDDVLATGGTAAAAVALVRRAGADLAGCSFLLEIGVLEGRKRLPEGSRALLAV